MQTWGLLCLTLLVITIPAYAQVQGGVTVPTTNSTQQQYCWNGTCQTTPTFTVNTSNDTGQELRSKYNIIMIIPSEGCSKAIQYHLKTNCPDLSSLIKYDNSNQKISGTFFVNNGNWDRTKPEVKNHWQYYTYTNKTTVCVYCTGNYLTTDLYKTIIIEPNQFDYAPKIFRTGSYSISQYNASSGSYYDITYPESEIDAGLTILSNRQIDPQCNTATISYSDFLLNDTINYMKSGCKVTHYNQTKTSQVPNSPWDYNNPYSSLHYMSALKQMTKGFGIYGTNQTVGGHGPGNCINGCSYTTSTKKAGW